MTMAPAVDSHLARTCWHLVAHKSELARDRDYVRLEWVLGELVLYNDKGDVIAFDNVCPHRGARFFQGESGNAPALCAYHGWSYRGGRLRVPRPETYRPCDLAAARLNRFQVAWCGDFLFAAVAPEADLPSQLGDLAPTLAAMSRDIDRRRDVHGYRYECPWRVAVENALEPDHVHMVHAETLGLLELDAGRNSFHGRNSVLRATIRNERMTKRLAKLRRFFDVPAAEDGYTALFVFPFVFLTTTFGYSYALQTFLPSRSGADTHFTTRLFSARLSSEAAEAITEPFFSSVASMNRTVFEEDHAICRRVDPSFPLDGPDRILSAGEQKVGHFRDSVAAVASARSAKDRAALRVLSCRKRIIAARGDDHGTSQVPVQLGNTVPRNRPGAAMPEIENVHQEATKHVESHKSSA
jgi:phenylpropionate dioxygenase-like ring-hydroxylating dioxygenase large terminal subunit